MPRPTTPTEAIRKATFDAGIELKADLGGPTPAALADATQTHLAELGWHLYHPANGDPDWDAHGALGDAMQAAATTDETASDVSSLEASGRAMDLLHARGWQLMHAPAGYRLPPPMLDDWTITGTPPSSTTVIVPRLDDPDLSAIAAITQILDGLDDGGAGRVLRYAHSRYTSGLETT